MLEPLQGEENKVEEGAAAAAARGDGTTGLVSSSSSAVHAVSSPTKKKKKGTMKDMAEYNKFKGTIMRRMSRKDFNELMALNLEAEERLPTLRLNINKAKGENEFDALFTYWSEMILKYTSMIPDIILLDLPTFTAKEAKKEIEGYKMVLQSLQKKVFQTGAVQRYSPFGDFIKKYAYCEIEHLEKIVLLLKEASTELTRDGPLTSENKLNLEDTLYGKTLPQAHPVSSSSSFDNSGDEKDADSMNALEGLTKVLRTVSDGLQDIANIQAAQQEAKERKEAEQEEGEGESSASINDNDQTEAIIEQTQESLFKSFLPPDIYANMMSFDLSNAGTYEKIFTQYELAIEKAKTKDSTNPVFSTFKHLDALLKVQKSTGVNSPAMNDIVKRYCLWTINKLKDFERTEEEEEEEEYADNNSNKFRRGKKKKKQHGKEKKRKTKSFSPQKEGTSPGVFHFGDLEELD
eukprot:g866.t1